MHVGVRWQPFGLEKCEVNDANRPLIKEHSSYAQFWVSWNAAEPHEKSTDYGKHMSGYLKAIDHAAKIYVWNAEYTQSSLCGIAQDGHPKAGKQVDGSQGQRVP